MPRNSTAASLLGGLLLTIFLTPSIAAEARDLESISIRKADLGAVWGAEFQAFQQWFVDVEPQMTAWGRCNVAFVEADLLTTPSVKKVQAKLRNQVLAVLPSIDSQARTHHLETEYAKIYYANRGYLLGVSTVSKVPTNDLAKHWADECLEKYSD